MAAATMPMLTDTASVPVATCCTRREISSVAAVCSSVAAATAVTNSLISVTVRVTPEMDFKAAAASC